MPFTASYVMGRRGTDVFESVFCDAKGSMQFLEDKRWLHDSAVSPVGT